MLPPTGMGVAFGLLPGKGAVTLEHYRMSVKGPVRTNVTLTVNNERCLLTID